MPDPKTRKARAWTGLFFLKGFWCTGLSNSRHSIVSCHVNPWLWVHHDHGFLITSWLSLFPKMGILFIHKYLKVSMSFWSNLCTFNSYLPILEWKIPWPGCQDNYSGSRVYGKSNITEPLAFPSRWSRGEWTNPTSIPSYKWSWKMLIHWK